MSVTAILNSIFQVSSKGVVYIPSLHIWNELPFIIDMNGTVYKPSPVEIIEQQNLREKIPEECVLCLVDKYEFYQTGCCGNMCCIACINSWYICAKSCPFCRNTTSFINGCK